MDPDSGGVCLNILRLDWMPVLSIKSIVLGLLVLLHDPSPEDPLDKGSSFPHSLHRGCCAFKDRSFEIFTDC